MEQEALSSDIIEDSSFEIITEKSISLIDKDGFMPNAFLESYLKLTHKIGIEETFIAYLLLLVISIVIFIFFIKIVSLPFIKKKIVAYSTKQGSVLVSKSAIYDLIQTVCCKESNVSQIKSKIFTRRKKINLQILIRIDSGSNLKEIEELFQNTLRAELKTSLGISEIGSIDIIATGIKKIKAQKPLSNSKEIH